MIIRKAKQSDIEEIAHVEIASGYHKKRFYASPMIKKLFKDKYENVFVLEDKTKILGYITLKNKNKIGELGLLAVTKTAQKKGFGLRLIKFILKYAKKIGCNKIFLDVRKDNYKAISLYKKLGFKVVRINKKKINNKIYLKLRMEKKFIFMF